MEPTYHNHELLLTCRLCKYQDGDIIVFENPDGLRSVKRIIASKNDDISINDGMITVNGIRTKIKMNNDDITLLGDYYVIGDNYLNSYDSRDYGAIKKEMIISKVLE